MFFSWPSLCLKCPVIIDPKHGFRSCRPRLPAYAGDIIFRWRSRAKGPPRPGRPSETKHTLVGGLAIERDRFQPIDLPRFAYTLNTGSQPANRPTVTKMRAAPARVTGSRLKTVDGN